MSKTRAAGLLGALIVGGLLLLSSLAIAAGSEPFRGYFAKLEGASRRACRQYAASGAPNLEPDAFLQTCFFVVRLLKPLTPPLFDSPDNTTEEEIEDVIFTVFRKKTPGLRPRSTCDECLEAVGDLESKLATNRTAEDIVDALELACESRFADPAKATQCREFVAPVPQVVDLLLANFPPTAVCEALKRCPMP